ncbi:MAG: HD domain-containing protein [Patescibacteria group bacterium]
MPSLQQHQLRVAAVAKLICENFTNHIDSKSIITACLLHDMGNILKSDLTLFPDFLKPEGLEYWQVVKEEFREKYGDDEHWASMLISKELGVKQKVLDLIDGIGFENIEKHFSAKDLENMICEYADCRVAPHGVVSLDERLTDLEERYGFRYPDSDHKNMRQKFYDLARRSETYIFKNLIIKPKDISAEALNDTIPELRLFEIS